jgi:hypothetical protein
LAKQGELMSSESKTNRLVIAEWVSMVTIFIGCFGYVHHDTQRMASEIHERTISQEQRTDRLYEMYCETQKEIKQLYVELVKERK